MFHVKHFSEKRILEKFKKTVSCNAAINLPLELIIYFSKKAYSKSMLCLDDGLFEQFFFSSSVVMPEVVFLPPKNFFYKSSPDGFRSTVREHRNRALADVASGKFPSVIVATNQSINEASVKAVDDNSFVLSKNSEYDSLVSWLKTSSYNNTDCVVIKGHFSLRGGIIDIYPFNSAFPVRISFLDDVVECFRFDIDTQIASKLVSLAQISDKHIEGDKSVVDLMPKDLIVLKLNKKNCVYDQTSNFSQLTHEELVCLDESLLPLFEYSSYIVETAYRFSDKIIVPSWFKPDTGLYNNQRAKDIDISSFNSLSVGDRLVHKYHGVAQFKGVFDFGDHSSSDERLLLEFLDGGKIYVSAQNLGLIDFHSSISNEQTELDSLSKKNVWNNRKNAAKKQVDEVVEDLLKSYASRSKSEKTPMLPDINLEKAFCDSFPFKETPDQAKSWRDISNDLASKTPMDRLLCGDVGFGKTEIALRASFRAVFAGKQVAVLAPTTILVNQHFHSFKARFKSFPVKIDTISSFKTKKENEKISLNFSSGSVDIIIGTHSLLFKNNIFNNLGLLVVDEEHRFGVKQKEKIVKSKNNIDVLSMSATPIPRTLHLSLSGIKSISTINTPPRSRYPIATQIIYYDLSRIKSLIFFEINRGGQVFFVHNRVKSLEDITIILKKNMPSLNICSAHGQMPKKDLEAIMVDFINQKVDVLVCTSIIEMGIDIPNANTIIINKAHRFGLSQLYQIRGRVGRGHNQAYAYLLVPKGHHLSKNAYRRLKNIEKNTSLGSGYNISKSDMEIRGVGSVFGYKQSGGLGRIGYSLYSKLIKESLVEKKIITNPFVVEPEDTSVMLYKDMVIPEKYISSKQIRLEFYRRLSTCDLVENFSKIEYEFSNRFGVLPQSLKNLINNYKVKIFCAKLGIKKCSYSNKKLNMVFISSGVAKHSNIFVEKFISFCSSKSVLPKFIPLDDDSISVDIYINSNIDIYTFLENILNKLLDIIS